MSVGKDADIIFTTHKMVHIPKIIIDSIFKKCYNIIKESEERGWLSHKGSDNQIQKKTLDRIKENML